MKPIDRLVVMFEEVNAKNECFPALETCPFDKHILCSECPFHQMNASEILKQIKTVQLLGIQNVETNRDDKTDGSE